MTGSTTVLGIVVRLYQENAELERLLEEAVDLLDRAYGRVSPSEVETFRGKARRARAVSAPERSFEGAVEELRSHGQKLTRQAVATGMEIDRKTLRAYIDAGLVPRPPWEGLKTAR